MALLATTPTAAADPVTVAVDTGSGNLNVRSEPSPPSADTGRAMGQTGPDYATPGQCTDGALQKWFEASGNRFYPAVSGSAKDWASSARSAGWTVVDDPQPRSIVVFQPDVPYVDPIHGHVAWVNSTSQHSDGVYVNITEMNNTAHGGEFAWWTRDAKSVPGMSYILLP